MSRYCHCTQIANPINDALYRSMVQGIEPFACAARVTTQCAAGQFFQPEKAGTIDFKKVRARSSEGATTIGESPENEVSTVASTKKKLKSVRRTSASDDCSEPFICWENSEMGFDGPDSARMREALRILYIWSPSHTVR